MCYIPIKQRRRRGGGGGKNENKKTFQNRAYIRTPTQKKQVSHVFLVNKGSSQNKNENITVARSTSRTVPVDFTATQSVHRTAEGMRNMKEGKKNTQERYKSHSFKLFFLSFLVVILVGAPFS